MPEKGAPAPDTAVVFSADNLLPKIPAPLARKQPRSRRLPARLKSPGLGGAGGVIVSPHKTQMFGHVLKWGFQEVAHFWPLCIVL